MKPKTKQAISLATLIALLAANGMLLVSCDNDTVSEVEKSIPVEVTFTVTGAHLGGQTVTIVFPAGISAARRDAIKAKFETSMADGVNIQAGGDAGFKTKVNAVLDKGLRIIVEDTSTGYELIVDGSARLKVEAGFVEGISAGGVANAIIYLIDNNILTKANQFGNAVCLTPKSYSVVGVAVHYI